MYIVSGAPARQPLHARCWVFGTWGEAQAEKPYYDLAPMKETYEERGRGGGRFIQSKAMNEVVPRNAGIG
jgi:hypothetical protein